MSEPWRAQLPALRRALAEGDVFTSRRVGDHDGRIDLRGFPAAGQSMGFDSPAPGMVTERASPVEVGQGTVLDGIDFSYAQVSSWRLKGARIVDCKFDRAECDHWRVWGSSIESSSFEGASLRDGALAAGDTLGGDVLARCGPLWREACW